MREPTHPPHALDVLTAALVSWTAASTQIVTHMRDAPTAPSHAEITATLTTVLRGALAPQPSRAAPSAARSLSCYGS